MSNKDNDLLLAQQDIRKNMKETFGTWVEVFDDEATEADIQSAIKDWESVRDEINARNEKGYEIVGADEALVYAEFLQQWNEKYNFWTQGRWRGVIKFDQVMKAKIEELKADKTLPLVLDYNTVLYIYEQLAVPAGTGLESALNMAKLENVDTDTLERRDDGNYVTWSHVLQIVYSIYTECSAYDKKANLFENRIDWMKGGIKTNFKCKNIEDYVEFTNEWLKQNANPQ